MLELLSDTQQRLVVYYIPCYLSLLLHVQRHYFHAAPVYVLLKIFQSTNFRCRRDMKNNVYKVSHKCIQPIQCWNTCLVQIAHVKVLKLLVHETCFLRWITWSTFGFWRHKSFGFEWPSAQSSLNIPVLHRERSLRPPGKVLKRIWCVSFMWFILRRSISTSASLP